MASPAKCRIGLLSTANIAKKNYRGILKTNNCELVAVASRDLAKAQEWAKSQNCPASVKCLGSYEELISSPDVDALYVPLPTSLHEEWVLKAVKAKKPVLLEKPAALDAASLERMLAAAVEAGVPLWDGVMFMHHERLDRMKADLTQPSFGRVLKVVSGFSFMGDEEFLSSNIRVKASLDGLGSLGDLGWYSIRFALWAMGWELPVSATGVSHRNTADGVPIDVVATLTWADGRSAHFDASFTTAFRQYCEVAGENGSLFLDDFVISRNHDSVEYSVVTSPALDVVHSNVLGTKTTTEIRGCNQEARMWEAFGQEVLACKAGKAPAPFHPRTALLTQLVTDAVMDSIRAGGAAVKVRQPTLTL